jgi:hypothetical protein
MRSQVVNFRADEELVAAIREQARREGVTLSEAIRQTLRRHSQEPPMEENPYAHLRAAAHGDLDAFRALAKLGERMLVEQLDITAGFEGLVFARLAAVRGDIGDTGRLLAMLALAEGMIADCPEWDEQSDQIRGECIAIVSRLADAGIDMADAGLPGIVANAGPQAVEIAKSIRERMSAI